MAIILKRTGTEYIEIAGAGSTEATATVLTTEAGTSLVRITTGGGVKIEAGEIGDVIEFLDESHSSIIYMPDGEVVTGLGVSDSHDFGLSDRRFWRIRKFTDTVWAYAP